MEEDLFFFLYPPAFLGAIEGIKRIARSDIRFKIEEIAKSSKELRYLLKDRIQAIEDAHNFSFIGIDSTWTTPHLELLYGDCALILYGCLGNEIREVKAEPVVYTGEDFNSFIWRKAVELERELAIEVLERCDVDVLIFDGNIFPFPMVYAKDWSKWKRISEVMKSLIGIAKEKGVSLVGIVKRVKSKYFSYILERETVVNDKLLASVFLRCGEFVSIGKFKDFLPKYLEIVHRDRAKEYIRRFEERCKDLPLGEVELVFYKSKKQTQYDSATKVEVLDLAGIGVDKIVNALVSISTDTGFPAVIDWIDEIVRNEYRVLAFLRDLLEKELLKTCSNDVEREIIMKLCGLTNPQKSYLFRL